VGQRELRPSLELTQENPRLDPASCRKWRRPDLAAKPHQRPITAGHRVELRSLLEAAAPILEALKAGRIVLGERDRLRAAETRLRSEAEESRKLLATALPNTGSFTWTAGSPQTDSAYIQVVVRDADGNAG
jgi:hypothetical protein